MIEKKNILPRICPNYHFDYSKEIAKQLSDLILVPAKAAIPLDVKASCGATGVVLDLQPGKENSGDVYLNTFIANEELQISSEKGILSAKSDISGELSVSDNAICWTPAPINMISHADEILTVTLADNSVYRIHTIHYLMPEITVTVADVADENKGFYCSAIDMFLLRLNTNGEMVYYRNLHCTGETIIENFAQQEVAEGLFYSYYVELEPKFRNIGGGWTSGIFKIMDSNFVEIDTISMLPNDDPEHTHGQGYLDPHELVMIQYGHYLTLSYTPLCVDNLPETVEGRNGGKTAWVWATIIQEIRDGKVLNEINSADYPAMYENAIEQVNFAGSSDEGIIMQPRRGAARWNWAGGLMDYVHPNSLDYTLLEDGNVDKLLLSQRNQCSVYQFDIRTGAIEWVLGGIANCFSGLDDYMTDRKTQKGKAFKAFTYGQHDARYVNKTQKHTIEGNPIISIFDNQTGAPPFRYAPPEAAMPATHTRVLKVELDETAHTARVFDVVDSMELNKKRDGYRNASHCGNVLYMNDHAVAIGWGLHVVVDYIPESDPQGTAFDAGYPDLRAGSRPVLDEYDMVNDKITFEFFAKRNALYETNDALFSYRTYRYKA